jgi:hypothetical protein
MISAYSFSVVAAAGDTVLLLVLLAVGSVIVGKVFDSVWAQASLSLIVGVAGVVVVGAVVLSAAVAFQANVSTNVALGLLIVATVALRWRHSGRLPGRDTLTLTLRSATVIAPGVLALHASDTVLALSDTSALLVSGHAMARGRIDLIVSEPFTFYSFPPGAKLTHALGHLYGAPGFHALGLALFVAVAALIVRIVLDAAGHLPHRRRRVVAVLAAAGFVTLERAAFIAHLNAAHMPVAAFLLVMAAAAFYHVRDPERDPERDTAGLHVGAVLAVIAVVLHRYEAAIVVAVVLLPGLALIGDGAGGTVTRARQIQLWQALGAATALWSAVALRPYQLMPGARDSWAGDPRTTLLVLQVAGLLLVVATLAAKQADARLLRRMPGLAAVGVWAAVAAYGWWRPDQLGASLRATATNLYALYGGPAGGWRHSAAALTGILVLVAVARMRDRRPAVAVFTYPALLFLPAGLLAGAARGSAYRVGFPDSLNRAWLHAIPLMIVAAAVTDLSRRRHPTGTTDTTGVATVGVGEESVATVDESVPPGPVAGRAAPPAERTGDDGKA